MWVDLFFAPLQTAQVKLPAAENADTIAAVNPVRGQKFDQHIGQLQESLATANSRLVILCSRPQCVFIGDH